MNSFGNLFRLTTFGESHGPAIGGIIDGLPSGMVFSLDEIQSLLDRRRPGGSANVSGRREPDRPEYLSGLLECDEDGGGVRPLSPQARWVISLGTPVGFIIRNTDSRSSDYDALADVYRPSHADFTYEARYGVRDHRGGGRASGRETAARAVTGGFACAILKTKGITISTKLSRLGKIESPTPEQIDETIARLRADHDSIGGIITCTIEGVPAGIGNPVFGKLQQKLASAIMSIGAVKGFDYGMGFPLIEQGVTGSEAADNFITDADGTIRTATNHSGGIQGGISNGMPIIFRAAVKPTPSLARPLQTVDRQGNRQEVTVTGRHDPAVVLRIAPVIEAMAAIALLDSILESR